VLCSPLFAHRCLIADSETSSRSGLSESILGGVCVCVDIGLTRNHGFLSEPRLINVHIFFWLRSSQSMVRDKCCSIAEGFGMQLGSLAHVRACADDQEKNGVLRLVQIVSMYSIVPV
jgi:hypothetical protein